MGKLNPNPLPVPSKIVTTFNNRTNTVTPELYDYAMLKHTDPLLNPQLYSILTISGTTPYPIAVAFSPDSKLAYVANYFTNTSNGTISVIDILNKTITATYTAGVGPNFLRMNKAGTLLFITNNLGNNFMIMDASNGDIIATIPTGSGPDGIAITADEQYAYVANNNSNNVSVLNLTTYQLIMNIPVGGSPEYISIPYGSNYAYVANYSSNTVSVIDTTNNQVVTTISTAAGPIGVTSSPDGSQVFVSTYSGKELDIIDVSTNTVVNTVSIPESGVETAISPDGLYAYVVQIHNATVLVVRLYDLSVVTTLSLGDSSGSPNGIGVSPDNKYLVVPVQVNGTVVIFDLHTKVVSPPASYELAPYHGAYPNVLHSPFYLIPSKVGGIYINKVTSTITVGTFPQDIAITPDGKYAYVSNGASGNVSVIDISTNTVTSTIGVGTDPYGIAITPDGKYAYVANNGSNNVSVIEISTNTVTSTITVGTNPYGIAITPDGKYTCVPNDGSNNVSVIEAAVPEYTVQDLTAQTSTATTAPGTSIGSITFTAAYTGIVYVEAIVRGSNNTVGNGITVGLYNGTTLLDSETYTQEGLASNEHTFSLFYTLSVTAGTAYTIYAYILAVTGGTVSAKLTKLRVKDQY
jgi:YVTN family beta-propeller protein